MESRQNRYARAGKQVARVASSGNGLVIYVNVHSPDHKSGEIRAQLKP
jgi:hypothetical protein